jgi:hypothetical protein
LEVVKSTKKGLFIASRKPNESPTYRRRRSRRPTDRRISLKLTALDGDAVALVPRSTSFAKATLSARSGVCALIPVDNAANFAELRPSSNVFNKHTYSVPKQ